MKRIITLLILLAPLLGYSQSIINQGTPNTLVKNRGSLSTDSIQNIPIRDTIDWNGLYGNLTIRPQDNSLWFRSPVGVWYKVLSNANTSNVFRGTLQQAIVSTNTGYDALVISNFGGGLFVRDDTVTVSNVGTQFVNAGGVGYRRIYDHLRPEYFGAIGDSVTNDSLAFANAIDFSSNTGEYIYLSPSKKYDARIDVSDKSILLKGEGTLLQQMGRVSLRAVTTLGAPIAITSSGNQIIGPITGKPSPVRTETVSVLNVTSPMNVFNEGDIYQVSSEDYYSWSEQVLGAGRYTYKTEFIDIGGVGYDYIPTAGGVSETSVVIGSTSGARGSTVSTVLNSGDTTGRLIFENVTGDFINGETITVNGVNRGTISSTGYLVVHGKMFDTYTTNPVIRKVNKDLKVDIQNVRFAPVGNVDSIVGSSNRQIVLNLRGFAYPNIKGVLIDRSWGRGIQLSNCFRGNIEARVNNLPNMAVTSESAYGYGVELYGGCEQNTVSVQGYNVRHGFTTNPSENSNIYANVNIVRVGVPKFNTVQNSNVYNSWAPGFDTHEGSYYTTFINCNVYSIFGLNKVISAAAGFQNRSLSTTYINCTSNGGIAGFVDATGAYTIDKPSVTQYINCRALNYQYIGFSQRTASPDSIHSFIYDNCYASADTATQNLPYYQVGYEIIGSNSKLYNCKSDNFNGIPASFVGGTYTKVLIDNFTADYTNSPSNASALRFVTGSNNYWVNNYKVIKNKNTNQPTAFFRNQSGTNGITLNKAIVLNDTTTMPLRLTIAGTMNINLTDNQFQQSGVTTKVLSGAGKRLPLDADFETTPKDGTIAYTVNTTDATLREFIRDAGTWKTLSKEDTTWMKNATQRDSTTQAFATTRNNNAFSFVTPITSKGYDGINPSNDRGSGIRFERRASATDFTANEIFTNTGPSDTSNLWRAYTMKSTDGSTIKVYKVDTFELRGHADATYASKATTYTKTQVDSVAAALGGTVYAKNGLHKVGDTVKLGSNPSNPYDGIIYEPTSIYALDSVSGGVNHLQFVPGAVTLMEVQNAGLTSKLTITPSNLSLETPVLDSTGALIGANAINMFPTEMRISGDPYYFKGLTYNLDFSNNFNKNDRSIPDVGWVKGFIDTTSTAGKTYIGSASITVVGDSITRAPLIGDVTSPANSNTLTIANSSVTNAKFRASTALSVVGRSSNSSGAVADISAATDGHVLRRNGSNLGFGTIVTAGIADGAITAPKLDINAIRDSLISLTASTSITTNQYGTSGGLVIFADATSGSFTITLPAAATTTGKTVWVKKTDSSANSVTVQGAGGTELIDGSSSYILSTGFQSVIIKSNSTKNLTF